MNEITFEELQTWPKDSYKLIDIRDTEKLDAWVKTLKLTDKQYKKLTELRKLANC